MSDKINNQIQDDKDEQKQENNNGISLIDLSAEEELAEETKGGGIAMLLPAVQKSR